MHRSLLSLSLILLLPLGAVPALAAEPIQELNRIVAVVDDDVITATELEHRMQRVVSRLRQQNTQLPDTAVLVRQVVERMVLERLQVAAAKRQGLQVEEEAINETIARIAAGNSLTLGQFRQVLERDGYGFARFREEIRNEMLIKQLRERQVTEQITITRPEVDQHLESQATREAKNYEYHLRHILIGVPEAASPEAIAAARSEAQEALTRLRNGEDFARTALAYSDGQQALEGGDLGWRKAGQLPTLFADQVVNMAPGDVSDLQRSASGFHIIQLAGVRGQETHMVEQVKARHILLETDNLGDTGARAKLTRLRQRILGGEAFSVIARANSDDKGTAADGGLLGWANPRQYVPAFAEKLGELQVGELSEPFKSQFGWHIIELLDRREQDNTEQYLRAQARQALHERKADEKLQNWLRRLRDEAYVDLRLEG